MLVPIMETEKLILKYMIEEKKSFIISDLSKVLRKDYKIVHTAVNRLIDKGILKSERIGGSVRVEFVNQFSKEVLEVEFLRREEILSKNFKLILNTLFREIDSVNFILLLFGSYAKKKQTKNSDIDLMFIFPSKKSEEIIEEIISVLPIKIHPLVFSEKEFIGMKNSKEENVVSEAIKSNVILYGIEQYYKLLKKW